jgi:hypothetical protein
MATDAASALAQVLAYAHDALVACDVEVGTAFVGAGLIAWDDCCGMLVVVPERVYATGVFPNEGPDVNNCYDGLIAMDVVVLFLACMPTVDDRGRPPTAAQMESAYGAFLHAAAVLWNALYSLPAEWGWEQSGINQTFLGTEGGCIGVETRVTVGLDAETWCPPCGD